MNPHKSHQKAKGRQDPRAARTQPEEDQQLDPGKQPETREQQASKSPTQQPAPVLGTEPGVEGDPTERKWNLLQRELRYWWGMLTEEDLLKIAGQRDQLLAVLYEKYGYTPEKARKEIEEALHKVNQDAREGHEH